MLGAALSLPLADRAHSSEIANLNSEIKSVRAEFHLPALATESITQSRQ